VKEEALKLANDLEELHEQDLIDGVAHLSMPQASAMIRRLVEKLDKLNGCLIAEQEHNEMLQTKPLSDEEITQVFDKCYPNNGDGDVVTLVDFARAIEERHGIK